MKKQENLELMKAARGRLILSSEEFDHGRC